MSKLADLLDQKINTYCGINKEYPSLILTSKESYCKLLVELEEEPLSACWLQNESRNYKGILVEFKENVLFELNK
jgi:hypothetical protein